MPIQIVLLHGMCVNRRVQMDEGQRTVQCKSIFFGFCLCTAEVKQSKDRRRILTLVRGVDTPIILTGVNIEMDGSQITNLGMQIQEIQILFHRTYAYLAEDLLLNNRILLLLGVQIDCTPIVRSVTYSIAANVL
jgi:hypothetical protein